jgi:DNA-directed RNA polymerase subunit P
MEYICFQCRREIKLAELKKIRCPYCGGKILIKKRPEIIKKIKAR